MRKSLTVRITLVFVFCVFATVIIRNGTLELSAITGRIAIALLWIVGVAWMISAIAKKARGTGADSGGQD